MAYFNVVKGEKGAAEQWSIHKKLTVGMLETKIATKFNTSRENLVLVFMKRVEKTLQTVHEELSPAVLKHHCLTF